MDASTVMVKYTYNGDANFDGKVDRDDLNVFITYYLTPPSASVVGWQTADFNDDALVNRDDLNLFMYGYLNQGVVLGGAEAAAPMEVTGAPAAPATSGTVTVTSQILSAGGQAAIPSSSSPLASAPSSASQPSATSADLSIRPLNQDDTEASDEIVLTVNVG